jgi:hypothetical protein
VAVLTIYKPRTVCCPLIASRRGNTEYELPVKVHATYDRTFRVPLSSPARNPNPVLRTRREPTIAPEGEASGIQRHRPGCDDAQSVRVAVIEPPTDAEPASMMTRGRLTLASRCYVAGRRGDGGLVSRQSVGG